MRATENFRLEVFEDHEQGKTKKSLSRSHGISPATVEAWYQDHIQARISEFKSRQCPRILGIDEHFFTRKKGYATTLVDLRNNKVFDVVLGRSEKSLSAYFKRLKGKEEVRFIIMDLSDTYRSIVRKWFPNAQIVSDRFHVVRLINHHFLKTWQLLDPVGRKSRGLLSLMRRHEWNMSFEQRLKLEEYFRLNPAIGAIYRFKQELMPLMLYRCLDKQSVRSKLPRLLWMIQELQDSPFEPMKTLGKTLEAWIEEIGRMWRLRKTNSITEGLHNKMEMISRRAFGFRNFENYRLRVLALCGWDGLINRV